jgi:hypothetical protein
MRSTDGEQKWTFIQVVKQKVWEPICVFGQFCRNRAVCFLVGLLYENDTPSLTRCISIIAFLAFLAGSAYLMLAGKRWDHYETFATLAGGGGAVTQIANKFMNSAYNSPSGQFPNKKGDQNNG